MSYKKRCIWAGNDALYINYHDTEWGVPVYEDDKLYEFLLLESFQAGLSWVTILKKRAHFRRAFDNFDYKKIARYDAVKIALLLQDKGIVRHKLKIHAAITNARAFIKIQEEFGSFARYIWRFTGGKPIVNYWETDDAVPARTPLSDRISKDLKNRGFRFAGSKIVYAFMQATGMVNDHVISCFRHADLGC